MDDRFTLLASPRGGSCHEVTDEGTSHAKIDFSEKMNYVDIFEKETLYFLFAYPKNVQENLTEEQKKAIRRIIEEIKKE